MKAFFKISFLCVIAALWAGASISWAEAQQQTAHDLEENRKIQITSNRLLYDKEKTVAEFSGNVRAVQDNTVITADSIKIFHIRQEFQTGAEGSSIEKIVASGNVVIHFDNRVAQTDQAVYIIKTKVLILTGNPAKVVSGNDSISGAQITYYQTNGRIEVESGQDERVEVQFYNNPSELAP